MSVWVSIFTGSILTDQRAFESDGIFNLTTILQEIAWFVIWLALLWPIVGYCYFSEPAA
jgi:hypothetical protein